MVQIGASEVGDASAGERRLPGLRAHVPDRLPSVSEHETRVFLGLPSQHQYDVCIQWMPIAMRALTWSGWIHATPHSRATCDHSRTDDVVRRIPSSACIMNGFTSAAGEIRAMRRSGGPDRISDRMFDPEQLEVQTVIRPDSRVKHRVLLLLAIFLLVASTETVSQQCFDEAPSVRDGGDPYEFITPTRLTSTNKKDIKKLFERLEGRWSGHSNGYFCRGTKGAVRKEADDYRIEMQATRDNPDEVFLTSNLTSNDNTTSRTEKLHLFLSENSLRVGFDDRGGEVRITQMPRGGSTIEFLHKVISRPGSDGDVQVTEILRRISVSATSLVIEYEVYYLGGLASGSTWKLARK